MLTIVSFTEVRNLLRLTPRSTFSKYILTNDMNRRIILDNFYSLHLLSSHLNLMNVVRSVVLRTKHTSFSERQISSHWSFSVSRSSVLLLCKTFNSRKHFYYTVCTHTCRYTVLYFENKNLYNNVYVCVCCYCFYLCISLSLIPSTVLLVSF